MLSQRVVLVVEDEDAMRSLISEFLTDEGFCIYTAADGIAALVALADMTPDLILCDFRMPYANGLDVAQVIRSIGIETPIVMMTADDHVVIPLTHVSDCLMKPFTLDGLLDCIERYIKPLNERQQGE